MRSAVCARAGPRSSSPIASRPSATPIASSSCTRAASRRRARTRAVCRQQSAPRRMCARLSIGKPLVDRRRGRCPWSRRSQSSRHMKILLAGIIARYPFGGVTWCSLMYLLGLRALGHGGASISRTPASASTTPCRTRREDPATALATFTARSRRSGSVIAGPSSTYDGEYHGRLAEAAGLLRRRRPVRQPVRRIVVLA